MVGFSAAALVVFAVGLMVQRAQAQDNSGYATYSNTNGGVCSGSASGLPGVAMNAAQFGGGSACGQCVQIQGTGNGAGQNPVSTAPYIAVITNVCPSCAPGDIDLQESGDGRYGISWSFVGCPGAGRKLIETDREEVSEEASAPAVAEAAAAPAEGPVAEDAVVVVVEEDEEVAVIEPAAEAPQPVAELVEEAAAPAPAAGAPVPTAAHAPSSRKLLGRSSS